MNIFLQIAGLILLLLVIPTEAKAYIDPGSGSLFLQVMVAAIAGALFHFRNLLVRLKWWK
ncbi:MAG: hypothetical protein U0R19_20985 [Bryobacteraceae bacterium]